MIKGNGWLGLFMGFILGAAVAAGLAYYLTHGLSTVQQQLEQQLLQTKADLTQAKLQNQTLSTQLSLELATQEALEQRLSQKQTEVGALHDQLAFYEHLLPLSGNGTVHIRALELDEQTDDVLHYKLLLQRPAGLQRFNGHIQFTAQGQKEGKSVTMVLDAAGTESANTTPIEFDQFLRTTGLLALPPDVAIDAITLQIYQGKQLRATHKVDLSLK